jgi:glutamate 5-kinase
MRVGPVEGRHEDQGDGRAHGDGGGLRHGDHGRRADEPADGAGGGARATWFVAKLDPQAARKAWISAMKPRGGLRLDAGAVAALGRGKSLLPAGVTEVTGAFSAAIR